MKTDTPETETTPHAEWKCHRCGHRWNTFGEFYGCARCADEDLRKKCAEAHALNQLYLKTSEMVADLTIEVLRLERGLKWALDRLDEEDARERAGIEGDGSLHCDSDGYKAAREALC
jgi:hypothetical protein